MRAWRCVLLLPLGAFVPTMAVTASPAADSETDAAPVTMASMVSSQESAMFRETSYQIRYPTPVI